MRLRLRFGLFLAGLLVVTLMLAACGDQTATPVPATTAPASTAAATTAVTTRAAATTAAATSAATTSVATTAAATTSAAATSAADTIQLPAIAGLKEIELDAAFKAEIGKQTPQLQNFAIKGYVSDDSDEKVAASLDTALTGAGYKYALPGATKISKQGDSYFGLYAKAGALDLLVAVQQIPADPAKLADGPTPGVSQEVIQKFVDQVKGKKTFISIIGSKDILKAVANGRATSTETAAATTAAGTTAAATPVKESTVQATAASLGQSGPGSELVGKLIATENADVRVKKVERFTELKSGNKTIAPKGVFMAVSLEIANIGKKPTFDVFVTLKDDKGNEIKITEDFDASSVLSSDYGYKSDFLINPGFVGSDYKLYDVPKDASSFTLEADNLFSSSTRQPLPDSFTNNGGKGPDSGAGQELTGKTYKDATNKADVKITKVERFTEIKSDSKTLKPNGNGVYLVVVYQAKNNGDKNLNSVSLHLKDSAGRIFSAGANFDLAFALARKYSSLSNVEPGKTGNGYEVFEVLRDASGFDLTDLSF